MIKYGDIRKMLSGVNITLVYAVETPFGEKMVEHAIKMDIQKYDGLEVYQIYPQDGYLFIHVREANI